VAKVLKIKLFLITADDHDESGYDDDSDNDDGAVVR